jgi:LmbE family N-acetylglucosaminyl deacetylase
VRPVCRGASGSVPLAIRGRDQEPKRAKKRRSKLLAACNAELGAEAPHWLDVRDKLIRFLERGQSVNLEKGSTARRRGLILEATPSCASS